MAEIADGAAAPVNAKPRRVRGPRKSTLAALKAADDAGYERGYANGLNDGLRSGASRWPGGLAALVLAGIAYGAGVFFS